jgi:hypothetical protein
MECSIILQSWPGTIRLAIAVSADPMPRRSAAVEGDLFTALPTEIGPPRRSPRGIVRGLN